MTPVIRPMRYASDSKRQWNSYRKLSFCSARLNNSVTRTSSSKNSITPFRWDKRHLRPSSERSINSNAHSNEKCSSKYNRSNPKQKTWKKPSKIFLSKLRVTNSLLSRMKKTLRRIPITWDSKWMRMFVRKSQRKMDSQDSIPTHLLRVIGWKNTFPEIQLFHQTWLTLFPKKYAQPLSSVKNLSWVSDR